MKKIIISKLIIATVIFSFIATVAFACYHNNRSTTQAAETFSHIDLFSKSDF